MFKHCCQIQISFFVLFTLLTKAVRWFWLLNWNTCFHEWCSFYSSEAKWNDLVNIFAINSADENNKILTENRNDDTFVDVFVLSIFDGVIMDGQQTYRPRRHPPKATLTRSKALDTHRLWHHQRWTNQESSSFIL